MMRGSREKVPDGLDALSKTGFSSWVATEPGPVEFWLIKHWALKGLACFKCCYQSR